MVKHYKYFSSLLAGAVFAVTAILPAQAQSDEIVVTGSRLSRYAEEIIPAVTLEKRADFALRTYSFECDTRDRAKRENELTDTLNTLIAKAKNRDDISLSVLRIYEDDYDEIVIPEPFTTVDPENFTGVYGRTDVSKIEIAIKTPVDELIATPEDAEKRIADFLKTVKMTGRTEARAQGDATLSVRNIERYRTELNSAILASARDLKSSMDGTNVEISGLESKLRWERSGRLGLTIYIPYEISVEIETE